MKNKRSVILTAAIIAALAVVIAVGTTFALFGVKSSHNISITAGEVSVNAYFGEDMQLYTLSEGAETNVDGNKFPLGGTAAINGGDVVFTDVVPGDGAYVKLNIENGGVAVKYRVVADTAEINDFSVWIVGQDGALTEVNADNGWTTLAADSSAVLTVKVGMDKSAESMNAEGRISFTVYAGQANATDAELNEVFGLNLA